MITKLQSINSEYLILGKEMGSMDNTWLFYWCTWVRRVWSINDQFARGGSRPYGHEAWVGRRECGERSLELDLLGDVET